MHIASLKPVVFIFSMLALSACSGYGPRTHDSKGRAVASPAMATKVFMNVCFKTGGNRAGEIRAIRRDKNLEMAAHSDKDLTSASHKTHSIDVLLFSDICSVSFDSGQSNAQAGTDAAILLLPQIGAKSMGGTRGGGSISFKTRKGLVMITNAAKVHREGAMLSLYKR